MSIVEPQYNFDELLVTIPRKFRSALWASQNIGSIFIPLLILYTVTGFGDKYPTILPFLLLPASLSFFVTTFIFIFFGIKSNFRFWVYFVWFITLFSVVIDALIGLNPVSPFSSITFLLLVLLSFFVPMDLFISNIHSKIKYVAIPLWILTAIFVLMQLLINW